MTKKGKRIKIQRLTPSDATRAMAIGVMSVHSSACAERFGTQYRRALEATLKVDIYNEDHVQTTLERLRRGPDDGWFWVAALEESPDFTFVHGFALCIVTEGENSVFIAELHVHPFSMRQGLATRMLREVVWSTARESKFALCDAADIPVTLNVIRERPADPTEHPAAWYSALGFVREGDGEDTQLGDVIMLTLPMISLAKRVITRLDARLDSRLLPQYGG